MKKILLLLGVFFSFVVAGCVNNLSNKQDKSDINVDTNIGSISNTDKRLSSNLDEVKYETLSPDKFKEYLKKEKGILIDLRTPQEIEESGVISSDALNIDFYSKDFVSKLSALDKNKTYFIYCRSGARSSRTLQLMKKMGFKKVYNLQGGILGWQYYGYKLEPYNKTSVNMKMQKIDSSNDIREITVNAKRFDFDKKEIRIKKGEKVKLIINNVDVLHGIDIPDLNIGDESELILDTSNIPKGEYIYLCGNYCGKGHSKMSGKIIIY